MSDVRPSTQPTSSNPRRPKSGDSGGLPDHLANPTTVNNLQEKINLLLKTAETSQRPALAALKTAADLVTSDAAEEGNVQWLDRLVNQVVCGQRTFETLAVKVGDVPGLHYHLARMVGAPTPIAETRSRRQDPPKPRAW